MDDTFTGICILIVLFWNFDGANLDLYDAIMKALMQ